MDIRKTPDSFKNLPIKRQEGSLSDAAKGIMGEVKLPDGIRMPGPWPKPVPMPEIKPPQIKIDVDRLSFNHRDKDDNGALSREEYGDDARFAQHDVNEDGKVTFQEYKNGRAYDRKDGDGDGSLTSDEYGVGKKNQDEFRRYDTNHDGKVSRQEFARGRFWDRLRDSVKLPQPVPMPMPMPLPRPLPHKLPDEDPKLILLADGKAEAKGEARPPSPDGDLSGVVAKLKAAQQDRE